MATNKKPLANPLSPKEKFRSRKRMKCKILIMGGNIKKVPHLRFEKLVTVKEVGKIVEYMAQFPDLT